MAEPDWQRVLGTARAALDAVKRLAIALPGPRMTTAEAIWYIALESSWAHQQRAQGTEDSAVVFAAVNELERELREWRWFDARGLPPHGAAAQKLPPDYWCEVRLDRLDVWSQALMVQSSRQNGGMHFGPSSSQLRHNDNGDPSSDTT